MPTQVLVPRARHRVVAALVAMLALVASTGAASARASEPAVDDAGSLIEPRDGLGSEGDDDAIPDPSRLVVTRALPFSTARAVVVDNDHGRIFVSGDNAVAVLDLDGTLLAYLEGHPGAAGMVLAGDSLYVAETTSGAIGRILRGATPTNAAPIATGLAAPREVAFAGGALWTVSGCSAPSGASLIRVALTSGEVSPWFVGGCALLAGRANRLALGNVSVDIFDATSNPPTFESTVSVSATISDLDLSEDGGTLFVTSTAAPAARSYSLPSMAPSTTYGNGAGTPTAVASSGAAGGLVAVGRTGSPNLSLYSQGNPTARWDITVGQAVLPNGIGFNADGARVYALATRANGFPDLHVIDANDATSQYGEFHPVDPARMHDSRAAGGRITDLAVSMVGRNGVPASGVSAVAVNVTVTEPELAGYLSVYPTGQPRPNASTLNFEAGQTVPNMTIVGVGPDGAIALFASQPTHVIVDVVGWFGTSNAPSGSLYHALVPDRWFDTRVDRRGDGTIRPVEQAGSVVTSFTNGRTTSQDGVGAVALNVTATNTTADGYLTVTPAGAPLGSSNLNWKAGETVPNAVLTKIDTTAGRVQFTNRFGRTDVVVDIFGYWDDGSRHAGKRFYPVAPNRLVDTRSGYLASGSVMGRADRLAGRGFLSVKADGGLPPGTTAVVLNITAVQPSEQGFLSAFPLGMDLAEGIATSIVNYMPGNVRPNMAILPVGLGGEVVIYNGSGGTIDIVADITGYFR